MTEETHGPRQKNREMLAELVEASKAFLVDDLKMPVEGVSQCAHCGAYHNQGKDVTESYVPMGAYIKHHGTCRAERLRNAIAAAKKILGEGQ